MSQARTQSNKSKRPARSRRTKIADPLPAMLEEYHRLRAEARALEDEADELRQKLPECDQKFAVAGMIEALLKTDWWAAHQRERRTENAAWKLMERIIATAPRSLRGLAVKAELNRDFNGDQSDPPSPKEALGFDEHVAEVLFADIQRMARAKGGAA